MPRELCEGYCNLGLAREGELLNSANLATLAKLLSLYSGTSTNECILYRFCMENGTFCGGMPEDLCEGYCNCGLARD